MKYLFACWMFAVIMIGYSWWADNVQWYVQNNFDMSDALKECDKVMLIGGKMNRLSRRIMPELPPLNNDCVSLAITLWNSLLQSPTKEEVKE